MSHKLGFLLAIGLALGGWGTAPGEVLGNAPAHSPAVLAERVARLVHDEPLGTPWLAWGEANRIRSIPYTGFATNIGTADYWLYQSEQLFEAGQLERRAYLIGDAKTPTLEFTQWMLTRSRSDSIEIFNAIWVGLGRQLEARFRRVSTSSNPLFRGGAFFHKDVSEFAGPHGTVRAYRSSFGYPGAPESIVIEYWSRPLIADAGASPKALGMAEFSFEDTSEAALPAERDAQEALGRVDMPLGTAIEKRPSSIADLPHVVSALHRADHEPGDGRDLLLYAAHIWARDLADSVKEAIAADLSPYLGAIWQYCQNDSLVYQLASRAGAGRWADAAFLELMDLGWGCLYCDGASDVCDGVDTSAPVIEHGEAFLAAYPRSPIRSEVAWRVAMAHETAWTLWKCVQGVPPEPWDPGREPPAQDRSAMEVRNHRDRAIELYRTLVGEDPLSLRSRAAARRVTRMQLDVATDYRRYWCFSD